MAFASELEVQGRFGSPKRPFSSPEPDWIQPQGGKPVEAVGGGVDMWFVEEAGAA